ncbi:MAG TPA: indole-3-glycerol phosphate synthase TrpC [Solirubrobacteraceae bacterium]|jgi:indole-3-glycerol phosphate synthase
MPSVLERILASTRAEVERRKLVLPLEELQHAVGQIARQADAAEEGSRPAVQWPRGFAAALARPGIAVIAEFKRRSPSAGSLREQPDLGELVRAYERGGASALSVLTEQPNFGGSLEDLSLARSLCDLPVLRKDFIVDEYQLLEARIAEADAVLLIVAALSNADLAALYTAACALGLDVLVEVHDREELQRALELDARLIGVNNRDLRDFTVDMQRTLLLRDAIPDDVVVVSESGIANAEQLQLLERERVDAVLVGESLMRASVPEHALRALLAGVRKVESETT